MKKGHLSFILHGERLKGAWDLVRMRKRGEKGKLAADQESETKRRAAMASGKLSWRTMNTPA